MNLLAISATAFSRATLPSRSATSGSQKEVRPTANPVKPGTFAAIVNHSTTLSSFEPRPEQCTQHHCGHPVAPPSRSPGNRLDDPVLQFSIHPVQRRGSATRLLLTP